jgi:hypothetical protein
MEQQKFWVMRDTKSLSKLAEWVDDEIETEKIICPANPGHRRGGKRLTDLSIALPGSRTEDFVWTWQSECLFTDHVLELFKAEGFTGFEVKPVKSRYKKAVHTPPRLWELVVTGWAGMAPPESGVRLIRSCPSCKLNTYSEYQSPDKLIDESQWDGSDFFMVWPLPLYFFITDRVAETIRRQHFSGAAIKPPGELAVSDGTFSAPRLSWWMPEARAREIGEPLGIY